MATVHVMLTFDEVSTMVPVKVAVKTNYVQCPIQYKNAQVIHNKSVNMVQSCRKGHP